jgi:hypothetical protein
MKVNIRSSRPCFFSDEKTSSSTFPGAGRYDNKRNERTIAVKTRDSDQNPPMIASFLINGTGARPIRKIPAASQRIPPTPGANSEDREVFKAQGTSRRSW